MEWDFSSILNEDEVSFDESFVDNTLDKLKIIKEYIEKTKKEYINLKKEIEKYINIPLQSQSISNLNTSIDNYINFLKKLNFNNNKNNNIQDNIDNYNNVKEKFINFYKEISIVCENKYFKIINEYNENSKKIINNIPVFLSPITSFEKNITNNNNKNANLNYIECLLDNSSFKENSLYNNIYGTEGKSQIRKYYNNNDKDLKCNRCYEYQAVNYCYCCNMSYCESCSEDIQHGKKHNLVQIDETIAENEKQKNIFLTSFMTFIKDYIFKCNYIIKNEKKNYVDQDTYKKLQYPSIQIENNTELQKIFLEEINDAYNTIKEKIDKENSITFKKTIKNSKNIKNN